MLDASSRPIDQFACLLARLPPHIDLDALGRSTKAFQRPRGVRSATDLFRLALAWGPGGYSMQRVAAWAGEQGIAVLTEDALVQRLHAAGPFLEEVCQELLGGVEPSPVWHGRVLRIADSSSLSAPASKGTDWRVHGVYDLGRGGFSHLEVTNRHGGEALDRGEAVAGEIRIADRGYANAQAWQRFLQSRDVRTDFIVRMRWNSIRLNDASGKRFDLVGWLASRPHDGALHEVAVWAQSGKHQAPIALRLVARRKTDEAIAAEHARQRRRASRNQQTLDPRSLVAAEYLVLATSLAPQDFPAADLLAVYRLRWQIELAFKRLKSLLHIDKLRTKTAAGTRCWLYAHLIVALLSDDLSQDVLDSFPSGPA